MKTLVAYFTAEGGRTARLAERIAAIAGADLFEIKPVEPYTKADLNYVNPLSRCNREKIGRTAEKLAPYVRGAEVADARMFNDSGDDELKAWLDGLLK